MLARCAFVLMLLAESASAQGYLGGSIGKAQYTNACDGAAAGISCASGDIGFRFFAGYSFTQHLAVEFGAGMLGTASASTRESVDLSAADLSLIGSWPISSRFSARARLGVYAGNMWSNGVTSTDNTVPVAVPCPSAGCPPRPPQPGWQPGSNTDATYGLGLGYAITEGGTLRLDWQRFQNLGGGNGAKLDVDLVSIGALVRFE